MQVNALPKQPRFNNINRSICLKSQRISKGYTNFHGHISSVKRENNLWSRQVRKCSIVYNGITFPSRSNIPAKENGKGEEESLNLPHKTSASSLGGAGGTKSRGTALPWVGCRVPLVLLFFITQGFNSVPKVMGGRAEGRKANLLCWICNGHLLADWRFCHFLFWKPPHTPTEERKNKGDWEAATIKRSEASLSERRVQGYDSYSRAANKAGA